VAKSISLAAFTDSISEGFGLRRTCGNQTYHVLGLESEFVSVNHEAGSDSYEIVVDTSNFTIDGIFYAEIEVGLENYPNLQKTSTVVKIDVKP
jgi:hypothetical protein